MRERTPAMSATDCPSLHDIAPGEGARDVSWSHVGHKRLCCVSHRSVESRSPPPAIGDTSRAGYWDARSGTVFASAVMRLPGGGVGSLSQAAVTEKSRQLPSMPLTSCSPRSVNEVLPP